ncbi:MAG TPA: hypothetical protein PKE45_24335, partial [Caldilineaceae bacterium]|nr:hypothetical protein [Caldilineaceae bacterium]
MDKQTFLPDQHTSRQPLRRRFALQEQPPGDEQNAFIPTVDAAYQLMIRDLPNDLRPRERLVYAGPSALSTAELLAIILRVGGRGENVIRMAERLLSQFGGVAGLAQASFDELCAAHGVGEAKAAQIKAALELGKRML